MRNIKKTWGLGMFLSLSLTSLSAQPGEEPTLKEELRKISPFNELVVANGLIVQLVQGTENKLNITAPEQLIGRIATKNQSGKLKIYIKGKKSWKGSAKILLTVVNLNKISVTDPSRVFSKQKLEFNNLGIVTKDAASIQLELATKSLSIKSSSASTVQLEGNTDLLTIQSKEASRIDASNFKVDNAKLKIVDAGKAHVFVTKSLEVNISDTGSVKYKGKPKNLNSQVYGAGSLID